MLVRSNANQWLSFPSSDLVRVKLLYVPLDQVASQQWLSAYFNRHKGSEARLDNVKVSRVGESEWVWSDGTPIVSVIVGVSNHIIAITSDDSPNITNISQTYKQLLMIGDLNNGKKCSV